MCVSQLFSFSVWYVIGSHFNSGHVVDEQYSYGDAAFGEDTSSYVKRYTCNFQYQSRDTEVTIGFKTYGMCQDESTDTSYCVAHKDNCGSGETFYNIHTPLHCQIRITSS